MNKSASKIRVRPLQVADFTFVRELAAEQTNFTIPPPYVLWLLLKIKGDICLVAEDETGALISYLLAVPIEQPANSLYVWQLAVSEDAPPMESVQPLLFQLRNITKTIGTKSIIFSTIPKSSAYRAIRRYCRSVFNAEPSPTVVLPKVVAPLETEFRITLR